MKTSVLILVLGALHFASSLYLLGGQGQSCFDACYDQGMNCNPNVVTNNSAQIFTDLGITCELDEANWWAEDQPSYCSGPNDPNFNKCVGFMNVPAGVQCSGSYVTTRRVCHCDQPSKSAKFFSTAYAGGPLYTDERTYFAQYLAPGDYGVITHMWITYLTATDSGVIMRYYIDGEDEASIVFTPSLACGVGFFDPFAPWGTQWFGKKADDGAWFNNFKIPFQKSIRVTIQQIYNPATIWFIMRGATNVPITVGGITLPTTAKMNMFTTNATYKPVDFVTLVDVPAGTQGAHWMHTLSVDSGNLNFLEGCYHAYTSSNMQFPGVLLSSGTEDYFDSAWYFNAGMFHLPVSGFTHYTTNPPGVQWSAYRFHDQDPLFFDDGFRLVWRNGDMVDPSGIKCMMEYNGTIAGSPTESNVVAYAWVYTW